MHGGAKRNAQNKTEPATGSGKQEGESKTAGPGQSCWRGKGRVRGQMEERSCPVLTFPHLPMGPEAKAWLKAVRMISVCQCQGKGYTVTGQK